MEPKKIYLSDYKPSSFLIDTVDLTVDIQSDKTFVESRLVILKNEHVKGKKINLELNGENLKLLSLSVNSKTLGSSDYQISSDKLVILNVEHDELVVETKVEINPYSNHALEGFYQSGPQLCTQCEPEGFRRITYYIDRPDVMAKFKTKMISDKGRYPSLLSNGNKIDSGDLAGGRHWVQWEDPFRKPCYLFAMVAGDFDVARDVFKTQSGRNVALEIYVDRGNLFKTNHALESLKKSMKWDEEVFGLEYDLDIYMIVAVDSFNMGAMENKGLNIFNSAYTLADQKSATDHDFQNIEGVIGHEYFHNWTGNRVTCRDWFQLTLKEGLTVYRDQEFSSDMLSRPVKRLEDVRMLKEFQFPEDAGPLAHPIRPSSFVEINNFYTRTVYEKGAEVIRMLATLIGTENFKKGMRKYFELHDGSAVTTEDFVQAMEIASGRDLSQFKNWYSRAGTPKLIIHSNHDNGKLTLSVEQSYPHTSWKVPEENILHMPFKVGFVYQDHSEELLLELTKQKETFEFSVGKDAVLSLNRGFTAPVLVEYEYSQQELLHLMAYDEDFYSRYEATQRVYEMLFRSDLEHYKKTGKLNDELPKDFIIGFEKLISDKNLDHSFLSYLLDLPSEGTLSQEMLKPDFTSINKVHSHLEKKLGRTFFDWFKSTYHELAQNRTFELSPKGYGLRSLKNKVLSYLVASGMGENILKDHFLNASNMTEELQGLNLFIKSGVDLDHFSIKSFYEKWSKDSLVMIKWFGALATSSPAEIVLKRLAELEGDPLFQKQVPNYIRSLYLSFARLNLSGFHRPDGSGYRFLADRIIEIDKFNPQVAARAATAYSLINKLDEKHQSLMREALKKVVMAQLSKDTLEVVNKYLAQ
jgi:aminopeptidase N